MKRILIVIFVLCVSMIFGCSVKYTANSVSNLDVGSKEICIIENTSVRESFLPVYRDVLEKKGFTVRILDPGAGISSCPITSTYTGKWSWDFKLYMAYAEIIVYRYGTKAGNAIYKAPRAGWALTTDIYDSTELKIATMVDQLFPNAQSSKLDVK